MKQLLSTAALFLFLVIETAAQEHDCNFGVVLSVTDGGVQEGSVITPLYGTANYPSSLSCEWVIEAPENHKISLVFRDSFGIEAHSTCDYDYLVVHDGPTSASTLLGRLCGATAPADIQATGNQVYLAFESDYSVAGAGFAVDWSTTCVDGTTSCDDAPVCFTSAQECDGTQTCADFQDETGCLAAYGLDTCGESIDASTAGSVSSPNGSLPFFPPGVACDWDFAAPAGYQLIFTATAGEGVDCTTASAELTEGSNTHDICNRTTTFIVNTNEAELSVSGPIAEDGFSLSWIPCSPDQVLCAADYACLPVEANCNGTEECSTGDDEADALCLIPTTTIPTTTEEPTTTVFSNITVVTEDPADRLSCYTCNGTGDCISNPANVASTTCEDGEHCWVERIGEAGSSFGLRVERGCGDVCSSYWEQEACETPQGRPKVCMKCCSDVDDCNDFIMTGHNEGQGGDATAAVPCLWVTALAVMLVSYVTRTLQ
ncbi:PREDICTED: bone morphogenetic protein 1-like [Branchiostoma belcheri]|uniref:Bone morphogenetic protein 1-like n=1 Tax=Branchiostoma belcheri TaxID=7741 RepID=A0A6P4YAY3_BRABE|nr:PREDICTED: bone morphogenetic protein 1-like [Branchiostoma belcheri]